MADQRNVYEELVACVDATSKALFSRYVDVKCPFTTDKYARPTGDRVLVKSHLGYVEHVMFIAASGQRYTIYIDPLTKDPMRNHLYYPYDKAASPEVNESVLPTNYGYEYVTDFNRQYYIWPFSGRLRFVELCHMLTNSYKDIGDVDDNPSGRNYRLLQTK